MLDKEKMTFDNTTLGLPCSLSLFLFQQHQGEQRVGNICMIIGGIIIYLNTEDALVIYIGKIGGQRLTMIFDFRRQIFPFPFAFLL